MKFVSQNQSDFHFALIHFQKQMETEIRFEFKHFNRSVKRFINISLVNLNLL